MIYLLDTNAISALMREDASMGAWLGSVLATDSVATCTIARGEILFGLERLALGRRRNELGAKAQKLFAVLPCEPIPATAADLYARVKIAQQRRGLPLDENDLWMAATALAINAALVTRDSDFRGIVGLAVVAP